MYAFKNVDKSKNILKGVSKSNSKIIANDEYKKFFDEGNHFQDCDNYVLRSVSHEMLKAIIKTYKCKGFVCITSSSIILLG